MFSIMVQAGYLKLFRMIISATFHAFLPILIHRGQFPGWPFSSVSVQDKSAFAHFWWQLCCEVHAESETRISIINVIHHLSAEASTPQLFMTVPLSLLGLFCWVYFVIYSERCSIFGQAYCMFYSGHLFLSHYLFNINFFVLFENVYNTYYKLLCFSLLALPSPPVSSS